MSEETADEVRKNTAVLVDFINQLCNSKNIFQGDGPPMGSFRTPYGPDGSVKVFKYAIFGTDGLREEGAVMRGAPTFGDVLKSSTTAFDAWLQPRRTLVWRYRPEVEVADGRWRVYWRCVQLDDAARSIPVEWVF